VRNLGRSELSRIVIRRLVRQKPGHCGPSCLEMMLSCYGIDIPQDIIMNATGIPEALQKEGARIDQLDKAIRLLAPDYVLLAKYDASVEDLVLMTEEFALPVGVEWQGVFVDSNGKRFEEGHFSLVVGVDQSAGSILMLDPDGKSALEEGRIPIRDFEERWWEENGIPLPDNPGEEETIRNDRLLFVLVPKDQSAALVSLGLKLVSLSLVRAHRNPR
jgi:hypothetical protein